MRSGMSAGTFEDQIDIERLIYQYAIGLDSLDKVALQGCFAPGAVPPDWVDNAIVYHQKYEHTLHTVLNHVHRVQGETAAGVTYAVNSMARYEDGKLMKFDIYMMYREELVKSQGQWCFAKRGGEIIFSTEMMPVQPGAPLLNLDARPGSLRTRPPLKDLLY